MAKGMGGHQSHAAQTHTWLTPPDFLSALGPFDLDPCAAPEPRPWPTARKHITLPEDGLRADWSGRVWCNPPYGRHTGEWLERMKQHGHGTALVFARTETEVWRNYVWRGATAVLFLGYRPHFCRPCGTPAEANSGAPVAFVAYGHYDAGRLLSSGLPGACVHGWSTTND